MSTNFPIRNLKFSISIGELAGRLKAGFINVIMPKKQTKLMQPCQNFLIYLSHKAMQMQVLHSEKSFCKKKHFKAIFTHDKNIGIKDLIIILFVEIF